MNFREVWEPMISSYSDKITSLMSMYTDYEDYIPLMKAFIGDGSDKVYLLAAQNTAEIRAAGGSRFQSDNKG